MTLSSPGAQHESSPTRLFSQPSTPSATLAPFVSSCAGTSTAASPEGSADERHADRIGYARGAAPLLYSAFLARLVGAVRWRCWGRLRGKPGCGDSSSGAICARDELGVSDR